MFGKRSYRHPFVSIFKNEISKIAVPVWIASAIAIAIVHNNPESAFIMLCAIPVTVLIFSSVQYYYYDTFKKIASADQYIRNELKEHPEIDLYDYTCWASFQAYKLYQKKHKDKFKYIRSVMNFSCCTELAFLLAVL